MWQNVCFKRTILERRHKISPQVSSSENGDVAITHKETERKLFWVSCKLAYSQVKGSMMDSLIYRLRTALEIA